MYLCIYRILLRCEPPQGDTLQSTIEIIQLYLEILRVAALNNLVGIVLLRGS